MEDTRKKELFPFFAYLYSQQLDPDKYGQVASMDEWIKTIQSNEEDVAKITQAAEQLSDEEWDNLDKQYAEQAQSSEEESVAFAAKGAKLKKLKTTPKKCKCGCDMVTVKEKGGKISSKCSCNCKGGSIKKGQVGMKAPKINTSVTKPSSPILSDMDLTLARHEKSQVTQANAQMAKPVEGTLFGGTFGQAFAQAREAKLREFKWNGKRYTTQVAGPKPAVPVKVNSPAPIPSASKPALVPPKALIPPTVTPNRVAPAVPTLPKWKIALDNFRMPSAPNIMPSMIGRSARYINWNNIFKSGGILTKQAGGPVKPTTPVKAKVAPKVTPKPSATVDNSPERKTAQKYKSEFYSKKGVKYDTQSGLPIAPMKAKGGLVKKQSGGDISQPIGTTQKGGKVKDRIGKSKAVVIPASLKCGGKGKIKPKTKK